MKKAFLSSLISTNRDLLSRFQPLFYSLFCVGGFLLVSWLGGIPAEAATVGATDEGLPLRELFFQLLNFSIFVFLLGFLLRKPIQKLFHKRQEGFLSFEKQSLKEEQTIRAEKKLWQEKLKNLEEKFKGIGDEALRQGESFAQRKQKELAALRARFKRELDFFIRLEREKAKRELLKKWQARLSKDLRQEFQKQALTDNFQQLWMKNFLTKCKSSLMSKGLDQGIR